MKRNNLRKWFASVHFGSPSHAGLYTAYGFLQVTGHIPSESPVNLFMLRSPFFEVCTYKRERFNGQNMENHLYNSLNRGIGIANDPAEITNDNVLQAAQPVPPCSSPHPRAGFGIAW
jgi:hypothetical protein